MSFSISQLGNRISGVLYCRSGAAKQNSVVLNVCRQSKYMVLRHLFVLIDRTTCQLIKKSVTVSSGMHSLVFLLFFLDALIFLKLTPKMRNLKLKYQIKKFRKNKSAKPRFY